MIHTFTNVSFHYVNALRRALLGMVETNAICQVMVTDKSCRNESFASDDLLRCMELIPVSDSVRQGTLGPLCNDTPDPITVWSHDFQLEPFVEGDSVWIHPDIPIMGLQPGAKDIYLEFTTKNGIGAVHAKWCHVVIDKYKILQNIKCHDKIVRHQDTIQVPQEWMNRLNDMYTVRPSNAISAEELYRDTNMIDNLNELAQSRVTTLDDQDLDKAPVEFGFTSISSTSEQVLCTRAIDVLISMTKTFRLIDPEDSLHGNTIGHLMMYEWSRRYPVNEFMTIHMSHPLERKVIVRTSVDDETLSHRQQELCGIIVQKLNLMKCLVYP